MGVHQIDGCKVQISVPCWELEREREERERITYILSELSLNLEIIDIMLFLSGDLLSISIHAGHPLVGYTSRIYMQRREK